MNRFAVLPRLLRAADAELRRLFGPLVRPLRDFLARLRGVTLLPVQTIRLTRLLCGGFRALTGTAPGWQFPAGGLPPRAPLPALMRAVVRAAAGLATPAASDRALAWQDAQTWRAPDGRVLSQRLWRNGELLRRRIDMTITAAVNDGRAPAEVQARVEQLLTGTAGTDGRGGFRRLFATEGARANGQAVIRHAERGGQLVEWVVSPVHAGPDECDRRAETDSGYGPGIYRADSVPPYPTHPHCFPAGTRVSGYGLVAGTDRRYYGEVVEIGTERGHVATVTPNHPILTSHGWVKAGELREGGDGISRYTGERVPGASIDPDDDHREPLIEDVAVTLRTPRFVTTVTVPTTTEDFHGDGTKRDVCVIRADSLLWHDDMVAALAEPFDQQRLRWRSVDAAVLAGERVAALGLEGDGTASHCGMGRHRPGSVLLGRAPGMSERLGRLHTARRDPGLDQTATDRAARNPEGLGEGEFGFAGEVAPDKISSIQRAAFAGHVYNLQTQNHWYIANGIVAHNCLCQLVSVPVGA